MAQGVGRSRGRGQGQGRNQHRAGPTTFSTEVATPRVQKSRPFSIIPKALGRLSVENWCKVAAEIHSVNLDADEDMSKLAQLMVAQGMESVDHHRAFTPMCTRLLHGLGRDIKTSATMWSLRRYMAGESQVVFEKALAKVDEVVDNSSSHIEARGHMLDFIDLFSALFNSNVFSERMLNDCLYQLLIQGSDLRVEAAAYLLMLVEPQLEHHQDWICCSPNGLQSRHYLADYYDRVQGWCSTSSTMTAQALKYIVEVVLRPRKEWEYEQAHKPVTSSRVVDSQDDEAVTSPPTKVTVSSIAEAIPTAAAKGCDLTGQLVSESADKGATHIPKGPACTGPGSSGPAAHKVVDEEASVIMTAAPGSSCVKKPLQGSKATVRQLPASHGRPKPVDALPSPRPQTAAACSSPPDYFLDSGVGSAMQLIFGDFPDGIPGLPPLPQLFSDRLPARKHKPRHARVGGSNPTSVYGASDITRKPQPNNDKFSEGMPQPAKISVQSRSHASHATSTVSSGSPTTSDSSLTARDLTLSESSDEFHSSCPTAPELRRAPYSSPSQASSGFSYATARSQTSSTRQNYLQDKKESQRGASVASAATRADMSSAHPGNDSTVHQSVSHSRAAEQHPDLDDSLSSALQELLLTDDRQEFEQAFQALLGSYNPSHLIERLLVACWSKLLTLSWTPVKQGQTKFSSAKQRMAAARQDLDRVFRKAGSIHPAIFNHEESLQLGPSRSRLCFKLHCSNKGYQLLTKQGWVEGQGLGANAGGMTQPFIPMHQSGAEAHLGLGCMRCNPILTGKGAEDELRDVVLGLCTGAEALFGQEAVNKAMLAFLSSLTTGSRPLPAEGLTWVGSLLGCLVAHGALTLQQVHRTSLAAAAASGKATQGKPCGVEIRRRLMQSAVDALAKGTCHTEAQQQLTSAGLEGHFVPAKVEVLNQPAKSAAIDFEKARWEW